MNRKFYKTIFTVEVLSEDEPADGLNLKDIDYEITEGHMSGVVKDPIVIELTAKEAAQALLEQASDPEFFLLTAEGEDLSEKDYNL